MVVKDRSEPTKLTSRGAGDIPVPHGSRFEGKAFPVIVQIKGSADAQSFRGKFHLDLEVRYQLGEGTMPGAIRIGREPDCRREMIAIL